MTNEITREKLEKAKDYLKHAIREIDEALPWVIDPDKQATQDVVHLIAYPARQSKIAIDYVSQALPLLNQVVGDRNHDVIVKLRSAR